MSKPDFVEEIDNRTKRSLTMNSVPVPVIKEFKALCDNEFGGNYAVGLSQLLLIKKHFETFGPVISSLIKDVSDLKKGERRSQIKTFDGVEY